MLSPNLSPPSAFLSSTTCPLRARLTERPPYPSTYRWAHTGFRINAISPGFIYSDMIASVDKAWTEDWLRRTPLGRMGTTEEVGKAVVALASDQFGFMTGSDVVMDGGEYRKPSALSIRHREGIS